MEKPNLRPPLTPEEVRVVKGLRGACKQIDSPICCFGHEPFSLGDPKISYSTQGSLDSKPQADGYVQESLQSMINPHFSSELCSELIFTNANPSELAAFHAACLPAHYGHGTERVYDESYRLAREMLPECFELNFDPLNSLDTEILSNIKAVCRASIWSKVYKINSYGPGGLFRAHKDTPREGYHFGTLVVTLPTVFEGGEFILRHGSMEHVLDWSVNGRGEHANEFHWVFFYADVEHEVRPVKSGYRITISYDIHGTHKPYHDVSHFDQELWVQHQGYEVEEQYGRGKIPESPPQYYDQEHDEYKSALKKVDLAWKLNPIFGSLLDAFHN